MYIGGSNGDEEQVMEGSYQCYYERVSFDWARRTRRLLLTLRSILTEPSFPSPGMAPPSFGVPLVAPVAGARPLTEEEFYRTKMYIMDKGGK